MFSLKLYPLKRVNTKIKNYDRNITKILCKNSKLFKKYKYTSYTRWSGHKCVLVNDFFFFTKLFLNMTRKSILCIK